MKNRENEKEKEKRKRKDRKRGREAGGNREDVVPSYTVIGLNNPNSLPPSLVEMNALDYLAHLQCRAVRFLRLDCRHNA